MTTEVNFLRAIVSPPDADTDFVAIHGLNPTNTAHFARETWKAEDGTRWLEDDEFLPRHFPKARVLLFGYNSNVAFETSSDGVEQHVTNLLNRLQELRQSNPTRPLVFLCHSLGGLIAKRAIVTAKLQQRQPQCKLLYQATRGFVFFGTPHFGSKKAKIGGILANVMRYVRRENDNTIMDALRENSLFSEALRNDFWALQKDFSFLSFYETKSTTRIWDRVNMGIIVPELSAKLQITHEIVLPRKSNHSGVCTYDNNSDSEFRQLVFNLKRVLQGPVLTVNLSTGALVLPATRGALKQWKFNDTDIANMSGAGRNTSTWLTANFKDRSLLEYHDIRSEDLLLRKGFVDPAALGDRWGRTIRLFSEGTVNEHATIPTNNIDAFTWTMVLIYAILDAALSADHCREIMMEFVIRLFDGDADDYLRGELPSHIGGWNSIASVRKITDEARQLWYQLEQQKKHQPGYIPESDSKNIMEFLLWLTAQQSPRFDTPSSDVHCLARILCNLGLAQLVVENLEGLEALEADESKLVVVLNQNIIPSSAATKSLPSQRRGMRIPLNNMREAISPWPLPLDGPDPAALLEKMLQDFSGGENAGKDIKFSLELVSEIPMTETTTNLSKTDVCYKISSNSSLDNMTHRGILGDLLKTDFLLATKVLRIELENFFERCDPQDPQPPDRTAIFNNQALFARYQCFVLGYYYGALRKLVVVNQHCTQEAFGSWGWWDKDIFQVVKDLRYETPPGRLRTSDAILCWRFGLLKVVAYLFAGADLSLIRSPGLLDLRATGVAAKLCLLSASMVGEVNDAESASKFFLLNIDRSCIPNTSGVIMAGSGAPPDPEFITAERLVQLPANRHELRGAPEDFTIHIEPDWDHDHNKCMVVYRDGGRIVQRLSPIDVDAATVLPFRPRTVRQAEMEEEVFLVPFHTFHGGKVATRRSGTEAVEMWASRGADPKMFDKALVVPTLGLPRARTCLMTIFHKSLSWKGNTPTENYPLHPDFREACVLYDEEARPIVIL